MSQNEWLSSSRFDKLKLAWEFYSCLVKKDRALKKSLSQFLVSLNQLEKTVENRFGKKNKK